MTYNIKIQENSLNNEMKDLLSHAVIQFENDYIFISYL